VQKKPQKPIPALPKNNKPETKPIQQKWIYLVVAAFALLLYANTFKSDYTVDDGTVIKSNKYTTAGISSLGKIFTSPYRAGFWNRKEGLYRPLSVAMFAIEWQIAPAKPVLNHVINVLLYALSMMVLFSVLKKILHTFHPLIPLVATLLFVAHPLHTEVVANIKSRDEILSLLFGLSSVYFMLKYVSTNQLKWMILSSFVYFLCLLSKESSITWIGVFPLVLWCSTTLDLKKIVFNMIPFIVVISLFFIIRHIVLGTIISTDFQLLLINNSLLATSNTIDRFATAIYILGKYLWLLFFPIHLVFDYSFNTIPIVQISSMEAIIPLLIFSGLFIYAIVKLKERSIISFGILFFVGTVILVSNIFFLIEATMAERFLYTPSLGFCIVIAILSSKLLSKKSIKQQHELTVSDFQNNTMLLLPLAIVLFLFSARTIARNADWKNNLTLLAKDSKTSPNSARICYAYGSAILIEQALIEKDNNAKQQYLDQAIEQLKKGVSLIPNYNDAWYHLGIAYKEKEDGKDAVMAFEQARAYKPFDDADHLSSSGIAYGMAGQYDKAIADLELAIHYDSTSADAYNNLGLYLSESGNLDAALKAFDHSLRLKKDFDKAYYNRGNAWAKVGNFNNAIIDYKNALITHPDYGDALNNIGNCYAAMQKPDLAKPWFEKAVNADPQNMKAALNYGITLKMLGDSVEAMKYIQRAQSSGLIH
jgi:tetratricopeptide (TPR) repeat protein